MISLSKALKVKNRLIGEIQKLQTIAKVYNSIPVESRKEKTIDLDETWNALTELTARLIDLKGKIAIASSPIAPSLIRMAEIKGSIAFFESLPIKEGSEDIQIGYGVNSSLKTVVMDSYVTEADRNNMIKSLNQQIDDLQDQIDEFNATTKIDFQ